jgi:hypothetical protein
MPLPKDILAYNASLVAPHKSICNKLAKLIEAGLPNAERKIWHRHPVWFLDGNPIVGYSIVQDQVRLMFWSGQSFDEPLLTPEPPDTKFKSAGVRLTKPAQVNADDVARWLRKSREIQWDYKNIVKRKGKLVQLQL